MCPTMGKDQAWNVWDSTSALFAHKDRKTPPTQKLRGWGRQNPSNPHSHTKLGFVVGKGRDLDGRVGGADEGNEPHVGGMLFGPWLRGKRLLPNVALRHSHTHISRFRFRQDDRSSS